VFTPKKLLRYPKAVSSIEEMSKGGFQELLDDPGADVNQVDTVVFCSGKIYYEVLEEKEKTESGDNMAMIRLEQLYPLPENQMDKIIEKYKKAERYIWLQEEPKNMGAWSFVALNYRKVELECISRRPSSSPASGSPKTAELRQRQIIDKLFSYAKQPVK
jgi:2-oxoglutarate dehydrogenase E1 component